MRKLTKLNLNELAKEMPVVNEYSQKFYIGGHDDNNCWWRCFSYLKSGGSTYDADSDMKIFDPQSDKSGMIYPSSVSEKGFVINVR